MIKIDDWILEDIKRIRKIPHEQRSQDESAYINLLTDYNQMVSQFNRKLKHMDLMNTRPGGSQKSL